MCIRDSNHGEWGDILTKAGAALNHDIAAYARELMAERAAADYGEVANLYLASELASVGDDDVIAEDAIVTNVAVGHDEVATSDDGLVSRSCAPVDCGALADAVVVANLAGSLLAVELEVLRDAANNSVLENTIVLAHAGTPADGCSVHDFATVSNDDVRLNCGERSNFDTVSDLRIGGYRGQRAYFAVFWEIHCLLSPRGKLFGCD